MFLFQAKVLHHRITLSFGLFASEILVETIVKIVEMDTLMKFK